MFYIEEATGELIWDKSSRDLVVLDCALPDALFFHDGDFDRVWWKDGCGYYAGKLVVTALSDGEDE